MSSKNAYTLGTTQKRIIKCQDYNEIQNPHVLSLFSSSLIISKYTNYSRKTALP